MGNVYSYRAEKLTGNYDTPSIKLRQRLIETSLKKN